jgi:Ca2+-binding RTX toxin-like protein
LGDNYAPSGNSPDCYAPSSAAIVSYGYNLIESLDGCAFSADSTDQTGIDPRLEPLANNGGPSATQAIAESSPAIDKGSCFNVAGTTVKTDQRGILRIHGTSCDIGAYELPGLCNGMRATVVAGSPGSSFDGTRWKLAGTASADIIVGTSARDIVNAGDGDDNICGLDGNDFLSGDAGDDYILGSRGDDVLLGDGDNDLVAGRDVLHGGPGYDIVEGDNGDDISHGGGDSDLVYGNLGADQVFGDGGDDRLIFDSIDTIVQGGPGFDSATSTGTAGVKLDLGASGIEQAYGSNAGDILTSATIPDGAAYVKIFGQGGNDTLEGSAGSDHLDGGAGDDVIAGLMGNDAIVGNSGADQLSGGTGNDRIFFDSTDPAPSGGHGFDQAIARGTTGVSLDLGPRGIERAFGTEEGDSLKSSGIPDGRAFVEIHGQGGSDSLSGSSGSDLLVGGEGDDKVSGWAGADQLIGGAGIDSLHGGTGDDRLSFDHADDPPTGGGGYDQAIAQGTLPVTLDLGAQGIERAYGTEADDTFSSSVSPGGDSRVIIYGQGGTDTISGSSGNDLLNGGTGGDHLAGGAGNDALYGGEGDDSLIGNSGADQFQGGPGLDTAGDFNEAERDTQSGIP